MQTLAPLEARLRAIASPMPVSSELMPRQMCCFFFFFFWQPESGAVLMLSPGCLLLAEPVMSAFWPSWTLLAAISVCISVYSVVEN